MAYGGTPAFMAPELFLTNSTIDFTKNEGIDVFALGATLYFMLCGKPPWMAKNQLDLATKIKNIELTFPSTTIDPHVKVLFVCFFSCSQCLFSHAVCVCYFLCLGFSFYLSVFFNNYLPFLLFVIL